ncbi:hypothetical protein CCP2SC5_260011 [Azospirillaceae bacterium]
MAVAPVAALCAVGVFIKFIVGFVEASFSCGRDRFCENIFVTFIAAASAFKPCVCTIRLVT